jgi:hypothetical protein
MTAGSCNNGTVQSTAGPRRANRHPKAHMKQKCWHLVEGHVAKPRAVGPGVRHLHWAHCHCSRNCGCASAGLYACSAAAEAARQHCLALFCVVRDRKQPVGTCSSVVIEHVQAVLSCHAGSLRRRCCSHAVCDCSRNVGLSEVVVCCCTISPEMLWFCGVGGSAVAEAVASF